METIHELILRYPGLADCAETIDTAADTIIAAYRASGTLFTCGNGGSAADADHIVGELMKGFLKKRPIHQAFRDRLMADGKPESAELCAMLQGGLPAISLHSQSALFTAYANDCDPALVYAQALYALAKPGDVLLAISTSGNAKNVSMAARLAKAIGVTVIALTGARESTLSALADCTIRVGATETYRVQELHLPVYHYLCAKVEDSFFAE